MVAKFKIHDTMYAAMLDYLNDLSQLGKTGTAKDTTFIDENFWLQDTAVVENIEMRKGEWSIYLVFAHHLVPLKFIKRKIVNYSCLKRATLAAQFMRRQAAKDQRGTLVINNNLISIIYN